jgi:multidrug resistance efflux pump
MRTIWSLRIWFAGLVLLSLSLVGGGQILRSHAGDSSSQPGKTASSAVRPIESVTCVGYADVEKGVIALTPAQPGRVAEILVHEDDAVRAGMVLLRLDDRLPRFVVRQAEADLKAARTQLSDARRLPKQHQVKIDLQEHVIAAAKQRLAAAQQALKRKQNLEKHNQIAAEEREGAAALVKEAEAAVAAEEDKLRGLKLVDPLSQVAQTEADVAAKGARLDQAKYALDECSLRAPTNGKILRILVSAGDLLVAQPRQAAIQFCPDAPRVVRAEIEQEYASRVTLGQIASIQDDSKSDTEWKGKVTRLSDWYTQRRLILHEPLQFNDVRTLECIIELDPSKAPPRIGQRVRVILGPTPLAK